MTCDITDGVEELCKAETLSILGFTNVKWWALNADNRLQEIVWQSYESYILRDYRFLHAALNLDPINFLTYT